MMCLLTSIILGPGHPAAADKDADFKQYLGQAKSQIDQKNYDLALENLKRAYNLKPRNYQVNMAMGSLYYDLGSLKEAYSFLSQAAVVNPQSYDANLAAGVAHRRTGHFASSLEFLTKASALKPEEATPYFEIGNIYYSGYGDVEKAMFYFQKAQTLNPGEPRNNQALGVIYAKTGDAAKAREYLGKAREIYQSQGNEKRVKEVDDILKKLS